MFDTIQCEVHMYIYEHYSITYKLYGSPEESSTHLQCSYSVLQC